jgi:hypothetical protein
MYAYLLGVLQLCIYVLLGCLTQAAAIISSRVSEVRSFQCFPTYLPFYLPTCTFIETHIVVVLHTTMTRESVVVMVVMVVLLCGVVRAGPGGGRPGTDGRERGR